MNTTVIMHSTHLNTTIPKSLIKQSVKVNQTIRKSFADFTGKIWRSIYPFFIRKKGEKLKRRLFFHSSSSLRSEEEAFGRRILDFKILGEVKNEIQKKGI